MYTLKKIINMIYNFVYKINSKLKLINKKNLIN